MTARPPRTALRLLVLATALVAVASPAVAAEHRLGVGAQFWKSVDDIVDDTFDDIEEDGFSYLVSYQARPRGLFSFELDLEYSPDGFGGAGGESWTPTAYLLVGHGLYAGVGVGVTYADTFEDDVSDPFYAARIGWELDLLPGVGLDINANYRADAFSELEDADTDAITLAGIIRFSL